MTPPLVNSKTQATPATSSESSRSASPPPEPIVEENFAASLLNAKRWTLTLDGGWGARDLQNSQGNDHSGGYVRVAGGLRFRPRARHTINTRLFFEYQDLNKNLGQGVQSNAQSKAVGAELDYGYAFHPKWFSLHGLLGLGASIFSAKAVEFSKNAQLLPFSATGTRVDLGAKLCTWRDALCFTLGAALDYGLSYRVKFVDPSTSNPPFGLNAAGPKIGISIDLLRGVENLRKNKIEDIASTPNPLPPPPVKTESKPTVDSLLFGTDRGKTPQEKTKVLTVAPIIVKPSPSAVEQLHGKDLLIYWEIESKSLEKEAINLALDARRLRDQARSELRKGKPDLKAARSLLDKGIEIYTKSLRVHSDIQMAEQKLKAAAKNSPLEFKAIRESAQVLRKVRRAQGAIGRLARLTHINIGAAIQGFNSHVPKSQRISFPSKFPGGNGSTAK